MLSIHITIVWQMSQLENPKQWNGWWFLPIFLLCTDPSAFGIGTQAVCSPMVFISYIRCSASKLTMNRSTDIGITDDNTYPLNTSQVKDLLKRKRRFRGIKSCFPCRHRKVRCDGASPCTTCVHRGHPELCCTPSASGSGQDSERGGGRPEIRRYVLIVRSRRH